MWKLEKILESYNIVFSNKNDKLLPITERLTERELLTVNEAMADFYNKLPELLTDFIYKESIKEWTETKIISNIERVTHYMQKIRMHK